MNDLVTEFDDQLWISMVDHVVVHSKDDIRVVYRDGIEKQKSVGFVRWHTILVVQNHSVWYCNSIAEVNLCDDALYKKRILTYISKYINIYIDIFTDK